MYLRLQDSTSSNGESQVVLVSNVKDVRMNGVLRI